MEAPIAMQVQENIGCIGLPAVTLLKSGRELLV